MKRNFLAATLCVATLLPAAAHAQLDGNMFLDEPPPPPWEQFKLNPKVRVKLDFRNASADAVLLALSQASGVTIVKDPSLTGGLTLQSPKPQSLNDAFAMLSAVLNLRNFDLNKQGNFLVIKARAQRGGGSGSGNRTFGGGGTGFTGFPGGGFSGMSPQLKVYAIKYASASGVARVINDVFANSGQNMLQQFMNAIPGGGAAPAAPAPATPGAAGASANLDNIAGMQLAAAQGFGGFGGQGGRGNRGGGGFPFGGGQGGGGGFPFGGMGRFGGGNTSVVRASADDYSNSVIVNAPTREQDQVAKIIEQLDKQTDQPQTSRVFPLKYVVASDMVGVVQNVLVGNLSRGRGGVQGQTTGGGGFGGFGGGFGGFGGLGRTGGAQAGGQVVAEARSNSLIVTTIAESMEVVEKVIKELDKEVPFENSSFVVTLENARADLIAQLLNQSFGGRNGAGGTAGRTGTGATGRTGNTGRAGGGGGGNAAPATLGAAQRADGLPGNAVALDLDDPDAASGELATTVAVAQGGGFGGFGQFFGGGGGQNNQNRRTTGPTTGLDSQGRVVNLRDLSGQVIAIPDVNTNSVIIVTSPENRAILQRILDQLDKIPEQVMIETLIVEASLDATSKLGVEWNFSQKNIFGEPGAKGTGSSSFGQQANTTQPQGFRYTLTGGQYGAFLNALQGDSRFEVLSTPRIFTSNNATATINISQSLPYVLSQRTDANGNLTFNYAFLDVGIILTVTPRITSNGYVTMDVTQTANDFVRYTDFNAPVVNQREAETTVSVKDGETVVLGGIIKNSVSTTVNKLPLVGNIPVLGDLFKSTSTQKSKTELLVFLTPRVVRDADEARRLREETQKKMQPGIQKKLDSAIGEAPPPKADKNETKTTLPPKEEKPG